VVHHGRRREALDRKLYQREHGELRSSEEALRPGRLLRGSCERDRFGRERALGRRAGGRAGLANESRHRSIETTVRIGAPRSPGLNFRRPEVQSAVAAREGGIWVVDAVGGLVWQIDPVQNRVKRTISVGAGARAVATGFGSVWVANGLTGTVLRIDPSSGRVIKRIKVAARLAGIATTGGAVWTGVP
jgi:hypothetical protein